ncbi:Putative Rhamnogalacturonan acetylesterase [Aspergillus calidoustus]|uniref:Putative Rhamnogalacturonan acetylesterase n=1 Tax=Aspergillus calidoustus TaxID=454130 RepID=A0A0U5GB65_ASPCI|nr:Putative Rhamnogalacturonan acetylesterase [Aspergillus calidoustus]
MKSIALSSLSLLPCALAQTVYLAGDSTMATTTSGWGDFIASSLSITVANHAIGGRSARSFTREGRFKEIADLLQAGDYVVIEFGHNDGGSLSTDNGRTDCPGTGDETCETVYNGVAETVLTFPAYLENAAALFLEKGAHVLISSQTPNNPWETGEFAYSPSRFVEYARLAAEVAGVEYVDHGAYTASIYEQLGLEAVNAFYPNDHTHTNAEGAQVVADAFLKAVVCGGVGLADVLTTTEFDGVCLEDAAAITTEAAAAAETASTGQTKCKRSRRSRK